MTRYAIVCNCLTFYLPTTLRNLSHVVGKGNVLLVGAADTVELAAEIGVEHVSIDDISKHVECRIDALEKVFKNNGGNKDKFEKFCFCRFFFLEYIMRVWEVSEIVHLDADILLYGFPDISNGRAELCVPNESGTFLSKWTLEALLKFNDFVVGDYFLDDNRGRYCDMNALLHFIKNECPSKGLTVQILGERGYETCPRADYSFRQFLIDGYFNKLNNGKGIEIKTAERLPLIQEGDFLDVCRISEDGVQINNRVLKMVHLQGDCKRYFAHFTKFGSKR